MAEIHFNNKRNAISRVVYRQHNSANDFLSYIESALENYSKRVKNISLEISILIYSNVKLAHIVKIFFSRYKAVTVFLQ